MEKRRPKTTAMPGRRVGFTRACIKSLVFAKWGEGDGMLDRFYGMPSLRAFVPHRRLARRVNSPVIQIRLIRLDWID